MTDEHEEPMPKVTPFLWFDTEAEQAAKFYCSLFKKSKILQTTYYGPGMQKAEGTVLTVRFRLDGQEFVALNGGPEYKFNPAVSFVVNCKTQKEIDHLWKKLTMNGKEIACGWLTDKYDITWQIVPADMHKWISSKDQAKANRVLKALMPMKKLILKDLQKAYKGK